MTPAFAAVGHSSGGVRGSSSGLSGFGLGGIMRLWGRRRGASPVL